MSFLIYVFDQVAAIQVVAAIARQNCRLNIDRKNWHQHFDVHALHLRRRPDVHAVVHAVILDRESEAKQRKSVVKHRKNVTIQKMAAPIHATEIHRQNVTNRRRNVKNGMQLEHHHHAKLNLNHQIVKNYQELLQPNDLRHHRVKCPNPDQNLSTVQRSSHPNTKPKVLHRKRNGTEQN